MLAVMSSVTLVHVLRLNAAAGQFNIEHGNTGARHSIGGTLENMLDEGKGRLVAYGNIPVHHKRVTVNKTTPHSPKSTKKRKEGRDGVDHSHLGLAPDPVDGMYHAWPVGHEDACHGAAPSEECIDADAVEWFRDNILLAIVTGAEGAFRVEVSQCTWLSHIPVENVFVFSDLVPPPGHNRTPHSWVAGALPKTVYEAHGDVFSPYVKEGYVKVVRRRGQGYSASWIVAQFRFAQAVEHMFQVAASRKLSEGKAYKWFMIGDDDTILQLPNLVKRLKGIDPTHPFYLSRKGWGGAGHVYSRVAFDRLMDVMPQCVEKYFVRSFRASDDMLLKCAHAAKLHCQMEESMSHCPASHLGVGSLLSPKQSTFHGKKDFYPPVLLTTWRVSLYYYASYCKSRQAAELAAYYSACAFGSCKHPGCTKEKNAEMLRKWRVLSRNNTLRELPFAQEGVDTLRSNHSTAKHRLK